MRSYRLQSIVRFIKAAVPVLAIGAAGYMLSGIGGAATFVATSEAETGILAGNASLASDTAASGTGDNVVRFGPVAAPVGTDITTFGAVCDGTTDDTIKIQQALDATTNGETLQIPAGKICRHTGIVQARNAGMRVVGPGTLLATNADKSAFWINADNVTFEGNLVVKMTANTPRLVTNDHHKIVILPKTGAVIRNITVDGSAAAGILMYGASNYLIEDVEVKNTLADGIHSTFGSRDGTINRPVMRNIGDDAVAVVSYTKDNAISRNITVDSPKLYGQTHGRGFTVVGGDNVTYKNVYVEDSSSAGLYVSSEGDPYWTYGSTNVKFLGGTIIRSNTDTTVDHGGIVLSSYNSGYISSDILIKDIVIKDTRATASRQVAILSYNGGQNKRVQLVNFTITGGPTKLLTNTGTPLSEYNTTGWTFNGTPVADHIGFTH